MGNPTEGNPAPAAAAAPAARAPAGWEFQTGSGWQPFDAESVQIINKALADNGFNKQGLKVNLKIHGHDVCVDLDAMTQCNVGSNRTRNIREVGGGYSAGAAPAAPYPEGQTEEDRGMMGGLAGAGAAAAALGAANHFGAFDGKVDPNNPNAGKHGFAQDHKWAAGALAVGGVIAAGLAGSAAQDAMSGGGKHGKQSGGHSSGGGLLGAMTGGLLGKKKKTGKKKDKSKKSGGGKKDKKVKSRDFDPNAEDSGDSESSYETGPEDEGYDPKFHSDGRPRTPP